MRYLSIFNYISILKDAPEKKKKFSIIKDVQFILLKLIFLDDDIIIAKKNPPEDGKLREKMISLTVYRPLILKFKRKIT